MDSITEMQEWRAARFERAVLPYLDHIYSAALLMTRDLDEADDLVLGTFAQAYASFRQVQRGTDVKARLHRALTSTFTDIRGGRSLSPSRWPPSICSWRLPNPDPVRDGADG
jgi:RNA polymerase sigma-70 factor (ECF subfamily)